MVEKMKTDVDRLISVLIMKKKFPIYVSKIELLVIFETKSSLCIIYFSTISQILKTKFHVF